MRRLASVLLLSIALAVPTSGADDPREAEMQLAIRTLDFERAAKLHFQGYALARPVYLVLVEELQDVSSHGLCRVHCRVSVAEQHAGILAVSGIHGYSDARRRRYARFPL